MAFPATFPVRKDMVEGSENWTFDPATYISNGPYKMKEWSHNSYILMEKNENYYDYENLGRTQLNLHFWTTTTRSLKDTTTENLISSRTFL